MTRTWPLITRKTGSMTQTNKIEKPLEAPSTEGIDLFDTVMGHDLLKRRQRPLRTRTGHQNKQQKSLANR